MIHRAGLVRGASEHGRVTFIELFFDLVFVLAITQPVARLIEHQAVCVGSIYRMISLASAVGAFALFAARPAAARALLGWPA